MEEEKKESLLKAIDLSLVAIVAVGVILGFTLKKTLKPRVTSSPEDRKIVAIKQKFNFDEIQKKIDEEMAKAQAEQAPMEVAPSPENMPQAPEGSVPPTPEAVPVPQQ